MAPPLSQSARDRLRAQVRREQDLAARVVSAETRLAAEIVKRDAAITDRDRALARRRDELADALTDYIEQGGVSVERAAIVLDRPKADVARIVRERRTHRGKQQRVRSEDRPE